MYMSCEALFLWEGTFGNRLNFYSKENYLSKLWVICLYQGIKVTFKNI